MEQAEALNISTEWVYVLEQLVPIRISRGKTSLVFIESCKNGK